MRINQKIMKTICPPAVARLFRSDRSGAFFNHLRQVALTAVMLAVVVMLAQVAPQRTLDLTPD